MKLQDQVVSLDLAKKMKELGFEQESAFYWRNAGQVGWQIENEVWMRNKKEAAYSAYTVAELGEILPSELKHNGKSYLWATYKGGGWYCRYETIIPTRGEILVDRDWTMFEPNETEANARAKMLCYLKENKLI